MTDEENPAQIIFDYWRQIHGHERAKLDEKRKKAINAMLSIGYEINDLKLAIYGCKYSWFHQGVNETSTTYDAITLILRDADHVDRFMAVGEERMKAVETMRQQRAYVAPPAPEARGDGEAYRVSRTALLSLVKKQA